MKGQALGLQVLQGVGEDAITRVFTPIGLDIGAQTPAEIAASVLAELVLVRREQDPQTPVRHMRLEAS